MNVLTPNMIPAFAGITGVSSDGEPEKKSLEKETSLDTHVKCGFAFWATVCFSFSF